MCNHVHLFLVVKDLFWVVEEQGIFAKEKCDYTWKVFGVSSHVVGRN
jgi:hypothetical protein